jgi:hypothetical protein
MQSDLEDNALVTRIETLIRSGRSYFHLVPHRDGGDYYENMEDLIEFARIEKLAHERAQHLVERGPGLATGASLGSTTMMEASQS